MRRITDFRGDRWTVDTDASRIHRTNTRKTATTQPPGPGTATIVVATTLDKLIDDGNCSWREAVLAANQHRAVDTCPGAVGETTIILPSGTYVFSIQGQNEDAALTGDLDLASRITLRGAGARSHRD